MYKIKRFVQIRTKPLWMQSLLYNISPSLYEVNERKEVCKQNLVEIERIIKNNKYAWHQSYAQIERIGTTYLMENSLDIKTKKGRVILSFKIIEC